VSSFTPVTTTVCAAVQFALVKTSSALSGLPSDGLVDETATVTSAVGFARILTVKLALPPASVVLSLGAGFDTSKSATSSSAFVATSGSALMPVHAESFEAAGPRAILTGRSPSATTSSWPMSVIGCGLSQSSGPSVSEVGCASTSAASSDVTGTTTGESGFAESVTLTVARPQVIRSMRPPTTTRAPAPALAPTSGPRRPETWRGAGIFLPFNEARAGPRGRGPKSPRSPDLPGPASSRVRSERGAR
jgi:hypothetical protein